MPDLSLLFIFRHRPYTQNRTQSAIDTILAAAALGQKSAIMFIDEGIWMLAQQQNTDIIGTRNISRLLSATPLYDIAPIYIEKESFELISPNITLLDLPYEFIKQEEIPAIIHQPNLQVLSF